MSLKIHDKIKIYGKIKICNNILNALFVNYIWIDFVVWDDSAIFSEE